MAIVEQIIIRASSDDAQKDMADLTGSMRRARQAMGVLGDEGEEAFDDTARATDHATQAMARQERQGKTLLTRLSEMGNIMTGVRSGLMSVRDAFGALRGGVESYLRQTKEGDQLWEQLERRLRSIKGGLIEMLVGTSDVEEGFAGLDRAVGLMQGVMRELTSRVHLQRGALEQLVTRGLSAVITTAMIAMDVFEQLRGSLMGLELAWHAVGTSIEVTQAAIGRVTALIVGGLVSALSTVLDALRSMARGAENLAYRLGMNGVAESLFQMDEGMRLAQSGMARFVDGQRQVADAFGRDSGRAINEYNVALDELSTRQADMRTQMDEWRRVLAEVQGDLLAGAITIEEYDARTRGAADAVQELTEELKALDDVRTKADPNAGLLGDVKPMVTALDEFMSGYEARQAMLVSSMQMLDDLSAGYENKRRVREEQANARLERNRKVFSEYANTIGQAFSEVAAGQQTVGEAMRGIVADTLRALAASAVAEAAMTFWQPQKGGPVAAAGLLAAAGGAYVAAGLIDGAGGGAGAGRGAASAGVAPPAAAPTQVTSTTNTTFYNSLGPVVTRDGLRELGSMMDEVDRGGYRRASRMA